jgi:hypothetical protein
LFLSLCHYFNEVVSVGDVVQDRLKLAHVRLFIFHSWSATEVFNNSKCIGSNSGLIQDTIPMFPSLLVQRLEMGRVIPLSMFCACTGTLRCDLYLYLSIYLERLKKMTET